MLYDKNMEYNKPGYCATSFRSVMHWLPWTLIIRNDFCVNVILFIQQSDGKTKLLISSGIITKK